MNSELALSMTVREFCAAFRRAEEDTRSAFATLAKVERDLDAAFITASFTGGRVASFSIQNGGGRHCGTDNAEHVIQEMRRQAWRAVVDRMELRRMMSTQRWKKLDAQLSDQREVWPELTAEQLGPFVRQFTSQVASMHEEAVVEVFNWLRKRDEHYKTGSKYHVTQRVVLQWCVEPQWYKSGRRLRYDRDQEFIALENVFSALDGRGQAAREHYSELRRKLDESPNGAGATTYYTFRAFKNGNIHLHFTRPDLVAKLNQIGGDGALNPSKEAA